MKKTIAGPEDRATTRHNEWLIGPFIQLLTLRGLPEKGLIRDEQLEILPDAGLLIRDGRIEAIGDFAALAKRCRQEGIEVREVSGPQVAMPGLIDAHTHICYAGSRAQDYAMRSAGKSYLDIAHAGGGIWDTVQKTRAATQEELTALTLARAERHLQSGVTTIEVKSGYGLTVDEELKMLRAIRAADAACAAELIPTCLPAHMVPKDFDGDEIAWIDHLLADFFPIVLREGLSRRADIFIEESAFSPAAAQHYLAATKALGFSHSLHVDQFTAGSSLLAVEFGARSADHLEVSGEREIAALAQSDVVALALPGASLGLGCGFTPGRRLLDAGAALAIASDWNPGSAPMGDLLTVAALYGAMEKLSLAEVFAGITVRAAQALGLSDRGTLAPGLLADFVTFPTDDYREVLYFQGQMRACGVWKGGR